MFQKLCRPPEPRVVLDIRDGWPVPTDNDHVLDRDWLVAHPGRRYRLRHANGSAWLIQYAGRGIYLRAFTRAPELIATPDDDHAQAWAWQRAAFPKSKRPAEGQGASKQKRQRADSSGKPRPRQAPRPRRPR